MERSDLTDLGEFILISKVGISLFLVISFTVATTAAARTQCVSIEIPAFNLLPDSSCSISNTELTQSALPDQVFLYDLGIPAETSCFVIIDPLTWESSVNGTISDPETGNALLVTVSGVAGLTVNAYPPSDPSGPVSFTAATLVSIAIDGQELASLVTRDAGTIFADGNAAARLSVVAGTKSFSRVSGYIDEVGQEFDSFNPAKATGMLCGAGLANSLF